MLLVFRLSARGDSAELVTVDYFFEPGCPTCGAVEREVLPRLEAAYSGQYVLRPRDINVTSNFLLLVACQERLGMNGKAPVAVVVDGQHALEGYAAISAGLVERVAQCLRQRASTPPASGSGAATAESEPRQASPTAVRERMATFAVPLVLANGLADGLNPCAFSTLVFLVSLLTVARVRGRRLLAVGASFCAASFLTYTALGFGLLQALRAGALFPGLRRGLLGATALGLVVLAVLSFRDAWRYAHARQPQALSLRLPDGVRNRIHGLMRSRLAGGSLAAGAFGLGVGVTVLESVCTGQMYVPTLVWVIGSGASVGRAWLLLLLYNAAFVLPLVAVFLLAWRGTSTTAFVDWSRRHVVPAKILLGGLFLVLAAVVIRLQLR